MSLFDLFFWGVIIILNAWIAFLVAQDREQTAINFTTHG
jgi:hypothetical protein